MVYEGRCRPDAAGVARCVGVGDVFDVESLIDDRISRSIELGKARAP